MSGAGGGGGGRKCVPHGCDDYRIPCSAGHGHWKNRRARRDVSGRCMPSNVLTAALNVSGS